jgi:Holliday junction resolvase
MADTPEKKVKRKVVEVLKQFGAYYFYPVTGGFGASGVPDIVGCYKGRFLGIEVKADMKKNKPTALQQKNLREIDAHGGVALVIDANNLDHLVDTLEMINEQLRADNGG